MSNEYLEELRLFEREEETAYHEAGHAIAALDFGCLFKSVSIIPEGNSAGRCHYAEFPSNDDDLDAIRVAIIVCAGPIAHGRFKPTFPWRERMVFEVNLFLNPTSKDLAERLQQITEEFVDRRWPVIERLAEMLLEHRTLSGDEVRAAIEPDPVSFNIIATKPAPPHFGK